MRYEYTDSKPFKLLIDVEVDVEEADRKKGEIGQKSAVFNYS